MTNASLYHIQEGVPLKPFNTFGVNATARYFCTVTSETALFALLQDPRWRTMPKVFLGGGSNILFTQDVEGLVTRLNLTGIETLREDADHTWLRVGAGENWHGFVQHCIARDLAGVENLSLIPGTVGAAPIQNIGAYGVEQASVFDSLEAIRLSDSTCHIFDAAHCRFGYRNSIFKQEAKNQYVITHVTFRLNKTPTFHLAYGPLKATLEKQHVTTPTLRAVSDAVIHIRQSKLPDPQNIGNAGSFFKNPVIDQNTLTTLLKTHPDMPHFPFEQDTVKVPAAWLIEQCGWKGKRVGEVGVHDQQALVLVNHGQGEGQAIAALAAQIQASVAERFQIALHAEVNIL